MTKISKEKDNQVVPKKNQREYVMLKNLKSTLEKNVTHLNQG